MNALKIKLFYDLPLMFMADS